MGLFSKTVWHGVVFRGSRNNSVTRTSCWTFFHTRQDPELFGSCARAFSTSPLLNDAYDVVIVGGGMVGAALACSLATNPLTRDLKTALVDGQDMPVPFPSAAIPEARVSTVTPASMRHFQRVGAWEAVERSSAFASFDRMQVWDHAGPGFVQYHASDVGAPVLGYVAENGALLASLHARLQELGRTELIGQEKVVSVRWPSTARDAEGEAVMGRLRGAPSDGGADEMTASTCSDVAELHLSAGRSLHSRLVVGADGGRSKIRELAGFHVRGWRYSQRALIATVAMEADDGCRGTAWQRFLPTGPLALLPLAGKFSNVVWSTSHSHAAELQALDARAFAEHVNRSLAQTFPSTLPSLDPILDHFTSLLPKMPGTETFEPAPHVLEAVGPRGSFPLSLVHATSYVAPRVALMGDAAHTVHPLAGQGVNLGFGDAEVLAQVLARAVAVGQDIGELAVLKEYEGKRQRANAAMMAALDGLQKTFAVDWAPFSAARNVGLLAVNAMAPVKNRIMSFAMG